MFEPGFRLPSKDAIEKRSVPSRVEPFVSVGSNPTRSTMVLGKEHKPRAHSAAVRETTKKCGSCGAVNPPEAVFCLKCGSQLALAQGAQSSALTPTKQFVTAQAQSAMSKMLETPGTIVLALGILLLLVSVLLIVLGQWSGLALVIISVFLLFVAVQLRGHEAHIAASQASQAHTVLQREIHEREIVKVKCRFCGALNPDGAKNCGSCGAIL